jgi:photosystem II stability/assembly factor-like uncharacterized protein
VVTFKRFTICVAGLAAALALPSPAALAHDSGIANGLFRSRDAGKTWLALDPSNFVSGALALAVHPTDGHQLLLGTDVGLTRSRNGGRDWDTEASDLLRGPAFAVAFDADGSKAIAAGPHTLIRTDGERWRTTRSPAGAMPARALVSGGVVGRAYLAGWTGLYRTDNWGRDWTRIGESIDAEHVSSVHVAPSRPEEVLVLAGGRLWISTDHGRSWRRIGATAPSEPIEAVTRDRSTPTRHWIIAAGNVYRSGEQLAHWQRVGMPIPDRQAVGRSLDVLDDTVIVLTDRGVFQSADGGVTWAPSRTELPSHAEAGVLLRDPRAPGTLYAGFGQTSLASLREFTRRAAPSHSTSEIAIVVGGYASVGLLLLSVGLMARRFSRASAAARPHPKA